MVPAARERRPLASSPGGGRHARERETSADDAGSCQRECPHHLFMLPGWAGEPDYGSFSRCGRGRRCIPAKQPVVKPTRPSSPGGGSAGDPSRLNRAAHRCVSVGIHAGQFSRWGLLPHAPCQPGASPLSALTRVPPPAVKGYAPRREPSRRLGPAPPRPCGPLCRPPPGELARGRRSRACASSALLRARRHSIFTATGPPGFHHRRLTALHRGTAGLRPASPPEGRRERVTSTALAAPGSPLHSAIYRRKAVRPLTRRSRSSRSCEVS